MSWYRYRDFLVAATSVATSVAAGSVVFFLGYDKNFDMAWRTTASSNAQLIEILQGDPVLTCLY